MASFLRKANVHHLVMVNGALMTEAKPKRVKTVILAGLLFIGGSTLGISNVYAFGDDGGIVPQGLPSPLVTVPACKLGTGVFPIPVGVNDARQPLTVVGKSPNEMLSREFESPDLVSIPYQDTSQELLKIYAPDYHETLRIPAANAVEAMIDGAKSQNIPLAVHSGYRADTVQCGVFNHKMKIEFNTDLKLLTGNVADETRVALDVNRRSALPGQSEHQLGTATDIVTDIPGMGWKLEPEMDQTPAFAWLQANAYKFGFVMSYPKGAAGPKAVNPRTGYVYEPWHWRYIGVVPARRYQSCEAQGLTTQQFLRALNANPKFVCTTLVAPASLIRR